MMHRRASGAVAGLVLGGLLLSGCSKSSNSSGPPAKLSVVAGLNDSQDPGIAVLSYLPDKFSVKTGETVEWTVSGPEPHTISLLPTGQTAPQPGTPEAAALQAPVAATGPYDGTTTVSSGLGPTGPQPMVFSISFGKAGSYSFFCAIHPQMTGTVTVTDDGSKADSQAAVTDRGNALRDQYLAEGRAAKQQLTGTPPTKTTNADGSTTWTVLTGASTQHTDVLAFQPPSVDIKVGDTVVFLNNSSAPHTATFLGGTAAPQDPEADDVVNPSGAQPLTLAATGYFNSGWLPPDVPPGQGPPEAARSFAFVVPSAGTYTFICVLHAPSGMAGAVTAT